MSDQETQSDLFETELEQALKSLNGEAYKQELRAKLDNLITWAQGKTKESHSENDLEAIQTMICGVSAARDILVNFSIDQKQQ